MNTSHALTFFRTVFLLGILLTLSQNDANAQEKILQFSGVVMNDDSTTVIAGAHIYVLQRGSGTTTNPYGFFSLPVLQGDSLVISAVGFKKMIVAIPKYEEETSIKLILALEEDVTFLKEINVFPYHTEALFKQAVITLELPEDRDMNNVQTWLDAYYQQRNVQTLQVNLAANQRYFQAQQMQGFQDKFAPRTNNLLNPFAWISFINSLKKK